MLYKYNQFKIENLILKNSSEIDSWEPSEIIEKDKIYSGTKKLDLKLGQKVIELFESNNLSIVVSHGDYLKKTGLILEHEEIFREYRVNISRTGTLEEYIDWEYGSIENSEKKEDELQKEYDRWDGAVQSTKIEWSVFLPSGISNNALNASAMSDSSTYLRILNKGYESLLKGSILDYNNALNEYPEGFKNYLSKKDIKITNKNIEIVTDITSRLYRDSKVFYYFKELFDSHNINISNFFKEWLNLM